MTATFVRFLGFCSTGSAGLTFGGPPGGSFGSIQRGRAAGVLHVLSIQGFSSPSSVRTVDSLDDSTKPRSRSFVRLRLNTSWTECGPHFSGRDSWSLAMSAVTIGCKYVRVASKIDLHGGLPDQPPHLSQKSSRAEGTSPHQAANPIGARAKGPGPGARVFKKRIIDSSYRCFDLSS